VELEYLAGIGAVIGGIIFAVTKATPKQEVREHDCIRKADIDRISARLEEGSITFERIKTEVGALQREVREQSATLREIENALSRLLGRLEK